MAEKILYYLGAGASARVLPLARSVWDSRDLIAPLAPKIPGLSYELNKFNFDLLFKDLDDDGQKLISPFKEAFKELASKADEFGDVDTYAKYLKIMQQSKELQKLKQSLSQYFAFKQIHLDSRDSRYLPWLVSIMSNKTFPDNVKILTWNYDFQVQLAAARLGNLDDVAHAGTSFTYGYSMFKYYPNLDPNPNNQDYQDLSLIHLNGIAGFVKNNEFDKASVFQEKYKGDLNSARSFIFNSNLYSNLHFAWENSDYHTTLMKHVESMIENTTIMVVIGYSFPFFNREIDKKIFYRLKNGSVRKIYYQDPVLTGEQLKAQFELPEDFNIVHIKSTDNFHVPFEY